MFKMQANTIIKRVVTYTNNMLAQEQIDLMQNFRDKYQALYKEIEALQAEVPKSRDFSLALTKLEESAMWLNKYITKND